MSKKKKTKVLNESEELTKEMILEELREEIIHQAKKVATNKIFTFYPLIEATKELISLEKELASAPSAKSEAILENEF